MKYGNIEKSFEQKRSVLGEVLPLDSPYTALIDISDMCNVRCSYCFRGELSISADYYRKNRLMDWATFEKVAEQLEAFPNQIKRISLSNHGEPLCNRLLPRMVLLLKQKGFQGKVEIHTNGLLLDEKYIDELVRAGIDRVVISLQGLSDEAYRKTCGFGGNFQHLVDMISLFYNKKINTQICVKIVDAAIGNEEDKFYSIFSEIADRVFVEKVVPLWTGIEDNTVAENKYGDSFGWQKCCPLVFYTINILPDGTIFPCSNLNPPFVLGNVWNTTLLEAWNSDKRKKFLEEMLIKDHYHIKACEKCFVPQNTVVTELDSIDKYRKEILQRIEEKE